MKKGLFKGQLFLAVALCFTAGNAQAAPSDPNANGQNPSGLSTAGSVSNPQSGDDDADGPVIVSNPEAARWYHTVDSIDFSPRHRTLIYGPDSTCRPMDEAWFQSEPLHRAHSASSPTVTTPISSKATARLSASIPAMVPAICVATVRR